MIVKSKRDVRIDDGGNEMDTIVIYMFEPTKYISECFAVSSYVLVG